MDESFQTRAKVDRNIKMPPKPTATKVTVGVPLPLAYRVFFLFIEPVSALVGAYFAHFLPETYLSLTDPPSLPLSSTALPEAIPRATAIALSQLGNLYLLFALNEALVLRAAGGDLRTWRAVLTVLLIADLGHLWTLRPLGLGLYWDVLGWNAMHWGNVPFVYLGATMRICFLLGLGLGTGTGKGTKTR